MCCQQMTPLDLPVLLLHQCQNKSLHQLSSLRALHLRARTSFFGRCLWSANHVVWAAVKPACMAAPCPCITVSCACAICLCISTPHARASPHPCVHAPLPGWASNAHGGTEPLQEQGPDPTHLGRWDRALLQGWYWDGSVGLNPACLLWDDWLRCRGHNLEQPWVFPKPRYLFDPTPCSQQLRLCFWRLWFSRVAQAGSSSGHGASALPTDKLLRVSLVPCDILGLSRRKQRTEEVCRCWTEEQLLLVAGSSRGLLQHAETPPNPASWNISVKLLSSYTVTVSYSSYLPR